MSENCSSIDIFRVWEGGGGGVGGGWRVCVHVQKRYLERPARLAGGGGDVSYLCRGSDGLFAAIHQACADDVTLVHDKISVQRARRCTLKRCAAPLENKARTTPILVSTIHTNYRTPPPNSAFVC